jgi:hypothetical protein
MPLTAPTGLAVTRMFRVMGPNQVAGDGRQWGPRTFQVFGRITWDNTEATTHAVELTVGGAVTWLPRGATLAMDVLLGTWTTPDVANKTVALSVKVKSATEESSAATLSLTVPGAVAAVLSGPLIVDGDQFELPAWGTGVMNRIEIVDDGRILIRLAQSVVGDVRFSHGDLVAPMPTTLRPEQTHRAQLDLKTGTVVPSNYNYFTTLMPGTSFEQRLPAVLRGYAFAEGNPVTLSPTIIFDTPATSGTFTASNQALRLLVGETARIPLLASHPATWVIDSGAPAGFAVVAVADAGDGIEIPRPGVDYVLVGTPTIAGTASVTLTATRTADSDTATATLDLTITATPGTGEQTRIVMNPGWLNNGLAYSVGDNVALALISQPAPAAWSATGLPPGIVMDDTTGLLSGSPTIEGRFIASITATAPGKSASFPALITFTIRAGTPNGPATPPSITPQNRIPWILDKWDLIDLQVMARTRAVESTLMGASGLRVKIGDSLAFAIFHIGAANAAFDLGPDEIRIILRTADNIGDSLVFVTKDTPTVVDSEPDPYYLIEASTSSRQREIVEEWVETAKKNEGFPCIGEIEWTKDGKVYSSVSFPVVVDLDVARP